MQTRNITDLLLARMPRENVEILRRLGELADRRGSAAFVVGGVVRDILRDIHTCDLDVVVDESAVDYAQAAAAELGGTVKTHTRFGTAILVVPPGRKIDLATARSEAYERPGALPVVAAGGIREDLERRDFTINSMAVRINERGFGELLDFHGGRDDLDAGVLRVLTDRSFEDDPTRILRGVRFASRFGFEFEATSERLLRDCVRAGGVATVSGERLMNEIVLILREPTPWPAVERLSSLGVLTAIDQDWVLGPGLEGVFARVGARASSVGRPVAPDPRDIWMVYLLAMLEPLDREVRTRVLERLRAGRRLRDLAGDLHALKTNSLGVLAAVEEPRRSEIYRAASGLDPLVLLMAEATTAGTRAEERITTYLDELAGVTISITGGDLVRLGVAEGPRIGDILDAVLDARLDGVVTSEQDELAAAERMAKNLDARNKS